MTYTYVSLSPNGKADLDCGWPANNTRATILEKIATDE